MHTLRIPFPVPPWREFLTELRIDVKHQPSDIEKQLQALYRRLNTPGDALHDLPLLCIRAPGLVLRYREADSEHYVYIEDPARRCLVGYVVFNRLIEVDRRADPHLRAPHAKLRQPISAAASPPPFIGGGWTAAIRSSPAHASPPAPTPYGSRWEVL